MMTFSVSNRREKEPYRAAFLYESQPDGTNGHFGADVVKHGWTRQRAQHGQNNTRPSVSFYSCLYVLLHPLSVSQIRISTFHSSSFFPSQTFSCRPKRGNNATIITSPKNSRRKADFDILFFNDRDDMLMQNAVCSEKEFFGSFVKKKSKKCVMEKQEDQARLRRRVAVVVCGLRYDDFPKS